MPKDTEFLDRYAFGGKTDARPRARAALVCLHAGTDLHKGQGKRLNRHSAVYYGNFTRKPQRISSQGASGQAKAFSAGLEFIT
jgi:hypothetical protein